MTNIVGKSKSQIIEEALKAGWIPLESWNRDDYED